MNEQILEQVQELRQNWIEHFKNEDQEEIAKAIKQAEPEELDDNGFISDLKQIAETQKIEQYIETFLSEVQELKGNDYDHIEFPIEKYKDLNKGRIAQEMADFAAYQLNMRPVDVDKKGEQTELYQYNMRTGVWEYFPKNQTGRLSKDMAGKEYSRHLLREFKNNIYNHGEIMRLERMGLPEHELLVNNKEVLKLDAAPDYETREIEKKDQALYKLDADFNPDADCPRWKELVKETLNNEENQIKTLQEYLGWLLKFPNRDHQKALLILGVTNSGKSQIAEVVDQIFNDNAVSHLSFSQLGMERRFHVNKIANSVVNLDKDMGTAVVEGTDAVKQAISQEKLAVEPKGEDTYTIDPTAKFVLCSNHAPKPEKANSEAFYGRFLTLKAPNTVPQEDRVPELGKKIYQEEASGILNWMLEGLQRLEQQGSFTVDASPYETKMMWNEYGRSVQKFVYDCIERGRTDDIIPTQELYEEYEIYMQDKMKPAENFQQFVYQIKQQPFIKKEKRTHKGQRRQCFVGLNVKTDSGNLDTN